MVREAAEPVAGRLLRDGWLADRSAHRALHRIVRLYRAVGDRSAVRAAMDPGAARIERSIVANAALLVRPHPFNVEGWLTADFANLGPVAIFLARGSRPHPDTARASFFDSLYYASAIVGVNTSAMVEAAILGKPVMSLLMEEFAATQKGTLHFHYLLPENGGFLSSPARWTSMSGSSSRRFGIRMCRVPRHTRSFDPSCAREGLTCRARRCWPTRSSVPRINRARRCVIRSAPACFASPSFPWPCSCASWNLAAATACCRAKDSRRRGTALGTIRAASCGRLSFALRARCCGPSVASPRSRGAPSVGSSTGASPRRVAVSGSFGICDIRWPSGSGVMARPEPLMKILFLAPAFHLFPEFRIGAA